MCGIFGVTYQQSTEIPCEERLVATARRLQHRGPDSQGTYSSSGVGFAHTRLSLLDIDPRSDQPFWDETGRYCLVYNGEIYNFKELREELRQRGVVFRTTGDTEVLLQSLINGPTEEVLPRLNGMFAFGLYDREQQSLLLARDRFGMKPLYVFEDDKLFLFGSEIKALRSWVDLEIDQFSVSSYLLGFGGPTKGHTFYRRVRSIPPGGFVRHQPGQPARHATFFTMPEFWDPGEMERLSRLSPRQLVDKMDELLYSSVEKHMFSDATVGAFCSGGVDSSLLMAMAARMYDDLAIFHANVKGRWSEHHAAVELARHLKLDLKTVDVEEQDFVDSIPRVMAHYEHPFTYHPNCAPLMMVSQLARDSGVKGLLSGEGSDECFLGYPWLGRKRLVDAYYRVGGRLRRLVNKIPSVGKIIWPDRGDARDVVRDLLNRGEIVDDRAHARAVARAIGPAQVSTHNLWTVDYLNYHLRTLLHRNDSMGMAASIEARFPFLDHDVVRMATNLPGRYKLRASPFVFEKAHPGIRDKWIVRKVADRYVPRGLSQRIKIGFWTTVFQRTNIDPSYFDGSFVSDFFELSSEQLNGIIGRSDQDLRMRLLHLDVWGRVCALELPEEESQERLRKSVSISPE